MPSRIAAVIFDLDGVLVDSTEVVEQAWRRWADEHDVPVDDVLAVAHGRPARDVVRTFAPDLDAEREANALDDWETRNSDGLSAVAGAQECVATAADGRWAIVTSGGRELALGRLRAVGLPIPPVLVTADDITRGKPDPEPYALASRALAVPPAACIVVEDAPAGITSAKRAGMVVVAVCTTHARAGLQHADRVCDSMYEVGDYLREAKLSHPT